MERVDALISMARDLAEEVVDIAGDLLTAGLEIASVRDQYVAIAIKLLSDAEAQAVLATTGDQHALSALARTVEALANLRDKARGESKRLGGR
jgi:hypothetical protein